MVCLRESLPEIREQIQNLADKLGVDYSTAKIILQENNGYDLDKAPSGAESKLYQTLLEHYNGDERKALIAKAKTYLQPFFDWFGNWTDPDATDVSKVIDENGEPLVVYHGGMSDITTFYNQTENPIYDQTKHQGYTNKDRVGIYFSKHKDIAKNYASQYKKNTRQIYFVFLNIKNPKQVSYVETLKNRLIRFGTFGLLKKPTVDNIRESELNTLYKDNDGVNHSNGTEYVVFNSNQVKSIDNQGSYSNTNNNIYQKESPYKGNANNKAFLDIAYKHYQRGSVEGNSNTLLKELIDSGIINGFYKQVAEKLLEFAPYKIELMEHNKGFEYNKGKIQIGVYSNWNTEQMALSLLHEMLHPQLSYIIENNTDNELHRKFRKTIKDLYYYAVNIGVTKDDAYGMKSQDEFAIELLSGDELIREILKKVPEYDSTFKDLIFKLLDQILSILRIEPKFTKKDRVLNELEKARQLTFKIVIKNAQNGLLFEQINIGNKLKSTSSKLDKTNEKLKKGIKQRLATIQRYQTKNADVIRETQRLIDKLNNLDSIEGTIEFVNFVRDNIVDAFEFLNNSYEDINSTQIVQLKRDYLGFFIPMMNDIKMILDTTDELNNIDDYDVFKQTVNSIVSGQVTLMNTYQNVLNQKTRDMLISYAESAGSTTVDQLINWLEDPNKDLNWFDEFLGQNSSTGNEVFRIMTDMLNNSVSITKQNTYQEGIKLVNLLNDAKKANKGIDIMSLLQEKDKNGQTTGYFTRNLNYGLFYHDLQKEYDKITKDMNLEKNSDGEIVFTDKEQEREFRKRRINAQLKYGNLKYTKEYYVEKSKLPIEAQDALDYVNSEIDFLIKSISSNGVIRWDKITDTKRAQLDALYRQKSELYSEFYADGEAKSGTDLVVAKALQKMRKNLKGKIGYKPDYMKFNASAQAIINKFGKDSNQYKKWIENATVETFTDKFYELLDQISTSDDSTLDSLYEERNTIMNMYRNQDSRAIEMPISDENKSRLIELDKQIAERRKELGKKQNDLKFSDFAEIRKTKQYYEDERNAKESGTYEEWYAKNHYEVDGKMRTASYYTYMYPKNVKYIIRKPNKFYSQLDQTSEYVNPEYDLNGEYIQPKKQLYDNTIAYNKIINNPTVKALYDALINKMQESNQKIAFAQNQNPYRLPQISGRMMATIARSDDKFEALKYVITDQFKIKDDDIDYVDSFEQRPDGSKIKLIPTRFMKMLDDPKMITSDVVGSVIQYFEMAENYKNMSAIQNDLEMTLYHIEGLSVNTGDEIKQGNNTRLYKKMVTLLDMNLYGKKKDKTTIKGYNLSKGLTKLFNYISLNNLAYNPWAITAGYVTGQGTLDIEAIAGKYFNIDDITFAKVEFAKRLGHITANIGNVNDKDKLIMLMQMNQVVRSNQETFDRLDQSSILRGINQHFWYNGYTMGDFTVKSQLLMATYHSYKYINGEYLTKEQYIAKYYPNNRKDGESHFKAIVGTLWDVYDVIDGELKITATGAQKNAAERMYSQVMKKVNQLAVRIDGNITDIDRTHIHQNAITQFIAMHRNFLISGLQERLKSKQFNYSTGQMEGGMYSDAWKFLKNRFSMDKINVITSIIADYNNLDELEKYNVRRVYMDIMNIMIWSMLISTLFVAAADDDPDEWYLQALAYAATRISFEFRTLYNPLEVTNLFNSPSAAVSTLENAFNYVKLVFPGTYFYESNIFSEVKSGVYKGWPKILRNTIKLTPIKNVLEATDTRGVRSKRNYLENQMMF